MAFCMVFALTGAVAADDGDEIAVLQGQVHVIQRHTLIHGAAVEGLSDVTHSQHDGSLLFFDTGSGTDLIADKGWSSITDWTFTGH